MLNLNTSIFIFILVFIFMIRLLILRNDLLKYDNSADQFRYVEFAYCLHKFYSFIIASHTIMYDSAVFAISHDYDDKTSQVYFNFNTQFHQFLSLQIILVANND